MPGCHPPRWIDHSRFFRRAHVQSETRSRQPFLPRRPAAAGLEAHFRGFRGGSLGACFGYLGARLCDRGPVMWNDLDPQSHAKAIAAAKSAQPETLAMIRQAVSEALFCQWSVRDLRDILEARLSPDAPLSGRAGDGL